MKESNCNRTDGIGIRGAEPAKPVSAQQSYETSDVELRENTINVDDYLKLRSRVGWKKLSREQAQKALDNSLLVVGAYLAGQPIGMGRLVGDGAVICYVQDLITPPPAQGYGVGSLVLTYLQRYVESLRLPGTEMMLDLMCAKGRENF